MAYTSQLTITTIFFQRQRMDYTFVINGDATARKRKAPQGACETCKKRKKRCTHGLSSSVNEIHHEEPIGRTSAISIGSLASRRPSSPVDRPDVRANDRGNAAPQTQSVEPSSVSRFIGDLNPEASLMEEDPGSGSRDRHDVGMWQGVPGRQDAEAPSERDAQHDQAVSGSPLKVDVTTGVESSALLPDGVNLAALIDVYFMRVNTLLPILDEDAFRDEVAGGRASQTLLQAICLAASKDFAAERHLCFAEEAGPLRPSLFASRLYGGLQKRLRDNRERDRIRLIQVLTLASLHSDGADGAEEASMHMAQAVHHAQTIGLHLGRSNGHKGTHTRLFWALWCLSKLNAALNGRPQLMFDRDIGLKIEDAYESLSPPSRVLLAISQLLSRVIEIYQPTAPPDATGIEDDFEGFENIIERCEARDMDVATMTSLELYYHSITILSHRARNSSNSSTTPQSTPSRLRQELSTLQTVTILRHVSPHSLAPLPIVPYSISLALSSFYRQLRRSHYVTKRAVAREHLESCVIALETLSEQSWPAKSMATIGRKVLRSTAQMAGPAGQWRPGQQDWWTTAHGNTDPTLQVSAPQNQTGANMRASFGHNTLALTGDQQAHTGYGFGEDGNASQLDISYDELIGMDTVFGDFMNMNLPDFGLPF